MLTTRHPVDFPYTRQEIEVSFASPMRRTSRRVGTMMPARLP
jgi:hypothetical protein